MATFKFDPLTLARKLLFRVRATGVSKKQLEQTGRGGRVGSIQSQCNYEYSLAQYIIWVRHEFELDPSDLTPGQKIETANIFLEESCYSKSQSTVDSYRTAIQRTFNIRLPRHLSINPTFLTERAYSASQVEYLVENCTPSLGLSIQVAFSSGLRAQGLLTIARQSDRARSENRDWNEHAFFNFAEHEIYVTQEKGGLVREIAVPLHLVDRLEACRLPTPRTLMDRKKPHKQFYDLVGGHKFSDQFTALCKSLFSWSRGAHGLRHGYALRRLAQMQDGGLTWQSARLALSTELGHFRPEITESYYSRSRTIIHRPN